MRKIIFNGLIACVSLLILSLTLESVRADTYEKTTGATKKVRLESTRAGVRIKASFDSDRRDEYDDDDDLESPKIRLRGGIGRVTFMYKDEGYESVAVAGNFNGWEPEPMELDSLEGVWTLQVRLEPGRYLYRFIVRDNEGEWEAIDPNNHSALRDSELGWVSRFHVKKRRSWYRSRDIYSRYSKQELNRLYGEEDFGVDYQRVDGFFIYASPGARARHSFGTSFKGKIGYGFKSEEWSASGTLAQPLVSSGRVQVLLSGYAETAYTPQTGVGELENVLAASLFKKDFRDYYRREGFCARLVYNVYRYLRLEAGYRVDDYSSLENKASWSLASGDFIPNPPVQEGTMRSVFGDAQWGSENTHLRADYETCGENLAGGDFEFNQLTAQARYQSYIGPSQRIDLRVKYGAALSGWLPNQRRYLAGGLGTVRGYEYQSLLTGPADEPGVHGGQQLLLANVEYKFDLGLGWITVWEDDWDWNWDWDRDLDFDLALFFDTGMAWTDKNADIDLRELKSSAGIGVLFGDEDNLRLDLIRVLDEDKDFVFQVRIERMF